MVEMDPNKYFLPNRKSKDRIPTTFSETNLEQRATKRKNDAAASSISKRKKATQPKEAVSRRKAGMTATVSKTRAQMTVILITRMIMLTEYQQMRKLECLSALCRVHLMFREISEKSYITENFL